MKNENSFLSINEYIIMYIEKISESLLLRNSLPFVFIFKND